MFKVNNLLFGVVVCASDTRKSYAVGDEPFLRVLDQYVA